MKDKKNTQSCEAQLQNRDYEDIKEGTENEKSPNEPLCEEFHDENGSEENYFDNEPVEILLNDEDFKRVEADNGENDDGWSDSSDTGGKNRKSVKNKKSNKAVPSESTLHERSILSLVFGVLSCSVFIGNPILALIGIVVGLSTKKYKHKSIYTTLGIISGLVGLALGLLFIMIPIFAFAFLFLLEILLFTIVALYLLVIQPMITVLLSFLTQMMFPAVMCVAFLI